jgi:hypothetical protein
VSPPSRVVVLVEGESDAVVVRFLAARWELDLEVVAMGGVTNVRRYAAELAGSAALLGLCDAGERRYLERLEPPLAGVFVCESDLEAELIRSLGPGAVMEALDEIGDLGRFRTFQGQLEWRGRDVADQLRRFAGAGSGRKLLLAERLALRLTPETTPPVLTALLEAAASGVTSR